MNDKSTPSSEPNTIEPNTTESSTIEVDSGVLRDALQVAMDCKDVVLELLTAYQCGDVPRMRKNQLWIKDLEQVGENADVAASRLREALGWHRKK